MASVARVAAKASSVSVGGMAEARPEVRVSTSDCATSGRVSSWPSAAAAAAKDGTPGVMVYGMPRPRRRRSCSPMALQTERSPECSRATSSPAAWAFTNSRFDFVEAHGRGVHDARGRAGNARAKPAAPASRHRGRPARGREVRARARVMRSAAPGPAPMKWTVMAAPPRLRLCCGRGSAE